MSGGLFDYENSKMYEWADKIWEKKTSDEKNFSILLKDVADVLHEYDYWQCGDTGEEDFKKALCVLKSKYKIKFKGIDTMELIEANRIMGIVNESVQKIIEVKEKVDMKRMSDSKAHLIYEGLEFCYLEMLEMQDKLDKFVLGEKDGGN